MAHTSEPHHEPEPASTRTGPVIMLSYAYSGAEHVQRALAAGTELACTSGTGIIPQCGLAAEAWRRIEDNDPGAMVSTVRGLVTAQVTAILASAGKSRWCELSIASPAVTQPFLQIFPHTAFICVHRRCLDVIRTWIHASPWGLQGQGMAPYLVSHPGNSVAALAAYWATSTEELLTFEQASSRSTLRVRYEDIATRPGEVVATARAWLGLSGSTGDSLLEQADPPEPTAPGGDEVPVEWIPAPLRRRVNILNAELGNPALPE